MSLSAFHVSVGSLFCRLFELFDQRTRFLRETDEKSNHAAHSNSVCVCVSMSSHEGTVLDVKKAA